MQTGLLKITTSDGKGLVGYFGDSDSNGKMYTGKRSGVHVDGDTYTYYFTESGSNKGAGYSGEKNDYLTMKPSAGGGQRFRLSGL